MVLPSGSTIPRERYIAEIYQSPECNQVQGMKERGSSLWRHRQPSQTLRVENKAARFDRAGEACAGSMVSGVCPSQGEGAGLQTATTVPWL